MPLVSVLMPVYNVEAYISKALRSLQQQTMQDFEIVAVNDGSTDRTLEVLTDAALRDPRIKVQGMVSNSGIVAALNHGLQFCHSAFIARLDGDDLAEPDRLQKQVSFLQSHPRIALVSSATLSIDEQDRVLGKSPVPTSESAITRTMLLSTPCLHTWLARRELYDRLQGYRPMPGAEDFDFLLRAVTAGFHIANLPDCLTRMRLRSGNTASTAGLRQRKAHQYVVQLYRERLQDGVDTFSPEGFAQAVASNSLEQTLHGRAAQLVQAGFNSRCRLSKALLCLLAAVISPWQARYFIDRARVRFIMRTA